MSAKTPAFITYQGDDIAPIFRAADLSIGDEVFIYVPTGRRSNVYRAVLTHKARVWATFQDMARPGAWDGRWRLRLDDQTDGRRQYSQRSIRFRTPAQNAFYWAQTEARAFLMGQGVVPSSRSPWRARVIELARLLYQGHV